ncbi:MAG: hypothetical protein QE263_02895 [Vampirovibrionales bacterium]|nr:hypothetical protein [Vampirovibrionales bacterium]
MAVFISSVNPTSAAVSPAMSQAAREFSRFSTGQTTGLYGFQPQIAPLSLATPNAPGKKANPWLMMAALTLLKLPFSFLAASTFNSWVFDITMSHSIQKELIGIGAEVLGTIGIKVAEDRLKGDSHSKVSHEKQLEIASGVVSFIGTTITTAACIKDSKLWGNLKLGGKAWRFGASLAVGTLCGVVEGFLTAKLEPWLERKLAK